MVKARAENEMEVVKAQADARDAWGEARVLRAEARATKAELETATLRSQGEESRNIAVGTQRQPPPRHW